MADGSECDPLFHHGAMELSASKTLSLTPVGKAPWAALVIDDDGGVRQSLRLCLEAAGARVLGVATRGAALEALDRGQFDVVFLDLWLGADAGLDLLPEMLGRQPDLPRVSADPLRLRAVFDNILSNALKYTPGGGCIRVEGQRVTPTDVHEPETVSISITDTGSGIPSAFRSRIFDKFFRLEHHHAEARPGARGAGIGLYMCRQIVELHGGHISCNAGPADVGTCITVTLPASIPADASPAVDSATYVNQ